MRVKWRQLEKNLQKNAEQIFMVRISSITNISKINQVDRKFDRNALFSEPTSNEIATKHAAGHLMLQKKQKLDPMFGIYFSKYLINPLEKL